MVGTAGSFRLLRAFGITVYLHWSWFLIVLFVVSQRSYTGNVLGDVTLVVSLFVIVTLHEYGHALACRSVGGRAETIVLWPLGGVAYVQPPLRPGAVLWSIVAGPLVNVALVPVTFGAYGLAGNVGGVPDWGMQYLFYLCAINLSLLVFNMLPIYPLDGGQTLMSLLWFKLGRAKSLRITSVIGMVAAGLAVVPALYFRDLILVLIAVFVGWQAWKGFVQARMIAALEERGVDVTAMEEAMRRGEDPRPYLERMRMRGAWDGDGAGDGGRENVRVVDRER